MSQVRKGSVTPKSAGKTRKSSMAPQKNSSLSANWFLTATDVEKRDQYDSYNATGDFERDFTFLCQLTDLKLNIMQRTRVPQQQVSFVDEKARNNSNSNHNNNDGDNEDINFDEPTAIPTTFVVSKSKYDYFKPHLEIETETIQNREHVRDLYLRGWMVDSRVLDIFQKCVTGLAYLSVFKLWNTGLTDETLTKLGNCLELTPSLKTLSLDGNSQVNEQRFHIFLQKPGTLNLENLSLRHCGLNDVGALFIADCLKKNDKLLTLNLSFNKLGDQGASHLINSLRFNRTLLSLNLSDNKLGDDVAKQLASVISTFPLTHDEVVSRRKQQAVINESQLQEKILPALQLLSGKNSKTPKKKDPKGGKTKGKASWDKLKAASPTKMKRAKSVQITEEPSSTVKDPLLGKTNLVGGDLWIEGNHVIINVNLSRNNITNVGLEALDNAVKYQSSRPIETTETGESVVIGLLNLSLEKNSFTADDVYCNLLELLRTRHPLYTNENASEEA